MHERLTARARNALALAEAEARALGCERVETAALLVGLALEHDGAAAQILERHDVGAERIRGELKPAARPGAQPPDRLLLAPDSARVLECADAESRALGHSYIGTEHILLALALVSEGEGHTVLR